MPRRGTYGSLEADSPLVAASAQQRSSRVIGDPEFESGAPGPFDHTAGDTSPYLSRSPGGFSWWRAGIITAAAATALSAMVGLVHLASYSGISQPPVKTAVPEFEEQSQAELQRTSPSFTPQHTVGKQSTARESVPHVEENPRIADQQAVLSFVALNEYTRRGDVVGVGYPWLEGKVLVEPYRETSLEVVVPTEGMHYTWNIWETADPAFILGQYEGEKIEVVFHVSPEYTVELVENYPDGTVSRSTKVDIFCKYVRREIRTLTDDERDEMFDAMKVLYDVGIEDGQKLYGDKYLDVWTIDEFHQIGASDMICDHLHDGIGFGITHSMVTLMFEQSLQAVNPKVTLPYWDFTIDAYLVEKLHNNDYSYLRDVSDLWTPEWFGGVDPVDFQVKDGRWGNLTVPIVEQSRRDILGADVYGRMRSPWNVNDRKYLTRGLGEMCGDLSTDFYDWPTCQTHYEMQAMYTSYYGYTWHSQYGPHGPTHIWIGGNLDCKENMDIVESIIGDSEILHITAFAFIERKDLFRDELFKCHGIAPEDMSAREVMESGQCGCLDLDLDDPKDYQMIFDLFAEGYDFPTVSEEQKRQLAIQYCQGVIGIGESSQSSSPLDPTFWSLHPTMERLLMFKRMTGTMTDLSWPDEPGTWVGEDGTVYDVVISLEADECYGHRGSDVFPYGILSEVMTPEFTFYGKTGPNTINNRDMVHLFDPRVNALSYIYDNYDWDHCTAMGWDMNDLFDPAAANQGRPRPGTGTDSAASTKAHTMPKHEHYAVFKSGAKHRPLYKRNSSPKKMKTQK